MVGPALRVYAPALVNRLSRGRATALVLAALCFSIPCAAGPPAEVPNPRVRDGTWVLDQAGALSAVTVASLNEKLGQLERDTGAEVGVAVVSSLDGLTVEEYAMKLFEAWAIGKRGRDDGALFLWSPADRKVRIEVGYGLEPIITDGRAGAILDRYVIPAFKDGAFDQGVLQGVDAIVGLIRKQPVELPSPATTLYERPPSRWPWVFAVIGAIVSAIGAVFGASHWRRRRPRKCPSCGARMRRLNEAEDDEYLEEVKRLEERIGSVDYDVWRCPECPGHMLLRYPRWFTRYGKCPQCANRTKSTREQVKIAASTVSAGLARVTETCEFCTYRNEYDRVIPMITSSSGSSSGGRSSSSSFGGGRSGGGGASRGY